MHLPDMFTQMAVDSYMVDWRLHKFTIGDSTIRHCAGELVGLQMLNQMESSIPLARHRIVGREREAEVLFFI